MLKGGRSALLKGRVFVLKKDSGKQGGYLAFLQRGSSGSASPAHKTDSRRKSG